MKLQATLYTPWYFHSHDNLLLIVVPKSDVHVLSAAALAPGGLDIEESDIGRLESYKPLCLTRLRRAEVWKLCGRRISPSRLALALSWFSVSACGYYYYQ